MRAHYLQHVPFEGLGSIEHWLHSKGYKITGTKFYISTKLPRIEEIDMLIIMGGPMSVNDKHVCPWLEEEQKFIKNAIELSKSTLGICLGAQLIANAMGGKVFHNSNKEIGWFPIQAVQSSNNSFFKFPKETEVFHWHSETFSLPSGAVHLAKSKACKNQAFQIGNTVIGLQFHLEITPDSIKAIVTNCRDELVPDNYIQKEEDILSVPRERYNSINDLMNRILVYLHNNNGYQRYQTDPNLEL